MNFMTIKTWNKNDILPEINSKDYNKLLEELESNVKIVESFKNKLKPDFTAEDFLIVIKAKEKISELASRLVDYSYLWFSEDTSNSEAKNFRTKVEQISVDVGNRIMFFSLIY